MFTPFVLMFGSKAKSDMELNLPFVLMATESQERPNSLFQVRTMCIRGPHRVDKQQAGFQIRFHSRAKSSDDWSLSQNEGVQYVFPMWFNLSTFLGGPRNGIVAVVLLIGLFWLKEVGFSILDPHKVELLQRGN